MTASNEKPLLGQHLLLTSPSFAICSCVEPHISHTKHTAAEESGRVALRTVIKAAANQCFLLYCSKVRKGLISLPLKQLFLDQLVKLINHSEGNTVHLNVLHRQSAADDFHKSVGANECLHHAVV